MCSFSSHAKDVLLYFNYLGFVCTYRVRFGFSFLFLEVRVLNDVYDSIYYNGYKVHLLL